jgi:hypothetical protein
MQIDLIKEKELIEKAMTGNYDDLIDFLHEDINNLSITFNQTKKGIQLEIPVTSLNKAAEENLKDAVIKYNDLIKSNDEVIKNGFSAYYIWFANQGIMAYAHKWEMMLNGGLHSGPCCH